MAVACWGTGGPKPCGDFKPSSQYSLDDGPPGVNDTEPASGSWGVGRAGCGRLAEEMQGNVNRRQRRNRRRVLGQYALGAVLELYELPQDFVLLGFNLVDASGGFAGTVHGGGWRGWRRVIRGTP